MNKIQFRKMLCLATALLLAVCMVLATASCNNKPPVDSETESSSVTESQVKDPETTEAPGTDTDDKHTTDPETESTETDSAPAGDDTTEKETGSDETDTDSTEASSEKDSDVVTEQTTETDPAVSEETTDVVSEEATETTTVAPEETTETDPASPEVPTETDPASPEVPTETDPVAPEVPTETDPVAPEVPTETDPVAPEVPTETDPVSPEIPTETDPVAPEVPTETDPVAPEVPTESDPVAPEAPTETDPVAPEVPTETDPIEPEVPTETDPAAPDVPAETDPVETESDSEGEETTEQKPCEHKYDDGVVQKQPTVYEQGTMLFTCTLCGETKTETIDKLAVVYYITMEGYGKCPVPEDGSYVLPDARKIGYDFVKWVDADGNDFASVGISQANVTVYPVFEIAPTTNAEELAERAEAGVDYILIANDIVIDRTIYVTGETVIYSEKAVKLIRAKDFAGNMFVVGQNADGLSSILNPDFLRRAKLTLGKPEWKADNVLLTIDGNRDNVTASVSGTAFLMVCGGDVDLYDGVRITNHIKVGNESTTAESSFFVGAAVNAGGSAFYICSGSTLRMYGGVIDNNAVNTTSTVNAEGVAQNLSAYGGAIYNNGNFYMYGGVISNNHGNRGGGIYTDSVTKIYSGILEGNYAKNKGGAICSSGGDGADLFISTSGAAENTVIFRNNSAGTQGGAILSYFDSATVIYHGVLFEGNKAMGGVGGAISTSGPITAYETKFINNSSTTNGGAIYQLYAGGERIVRIVDLEGCYFEGNRANKGGAISITSEDEVKGTILNVTDCQFVNNTAYLKITEKIDSETGETTVSRSTGNGGAIYSSQHGNVTAIGCTFTGNRAENLGGGAIGATVGSTVYIENCEFTENAAVDADGAENGISGVGGALYVYNESQVTVKNTKFIRNSAAKNGGAIYCSANTVTLENVEFIGNTAGEHGGAISQHSENQLTVKGIIAYSNSAKTYGGVIYNSKSTLTVTGGEGVVNQIGMLGETDEETENLKNTAASGGAICAASSSIVVIDGTTFANNHAIGDGNGDYNRYGGAIYATYGSQVTVNGVDFSDNGAGYGGAVALMKAETVFKLTDSKIESNTSTNCGGGFYVLAATAELTDVEASGNVSAKGGVLYLSSLSNTTLAGEVDFFGNSATYGGVAYVSGATLADLRGAKFKGNGMGEVKPASQGGAIYVVSAEVLLDGCLFENNTSTSKGGAICLVATEKKTDDQGVETKTDPAIVQLSQTEFVGNSSQNGGAVYAATDGEIYADSAKFTGNSAKATEDDNDARGGAIYMLGAKLVADGATFEQNSADFYGGAIDGHTGSQVVLTNVKFAENMAKGNGGAIWAYTNTTVEITNVMATRNTTESYGGFVYTRGSFTLATSEGGTNLFEENSSKSRGGVLAGAASSVLNVVNTQFKNNSGSSGGAVYSLSETTIENCIFSNNNASSGGAICVSGGVLTTLDCIFEQNTAKNYGGAVYVTENSSYVDGLEAVQSAEGEVDTRASSFTGNTAASGGALYNAGVEDIVNDPDHVGGIITINGSEFDSNTATNGGAIGVGKGCVLTDNASTYTNNTAWRGGAIIVAYDGDHPTPEVKAYINGSVFSGNTAKATETNNEARGGAIHVGEYTTVVITDAKFENNTAVQYGGAISGARGASVTAKNCEFNTNSADVNGGAVWAYSDTTVNISDSSLDSNAAGSYGGALYTYSTMTVSNSQLGENTASAGGAIYQVSGTTNTLGCTFISNVSKNGGAVYVGENANYADGNDEGNGSSFTENKAYRGGAVYVAYETSELSERVKASLSGSTFTQNAVAPTEDSDTKSRGGAIYVGDYLRVSISGATFTGNTATQYGGAVSGARGCEITVTDTEFNGNSAGSNGGAMWTYYGSAVSFSDSDFIGNVTNANGGAIYSYGAMTAQSGTFDANKAENGNGGAVYVAETGSFTYTATDTIAVTDGVVETDYAGPAFKNNVAEKGDAIYLAPVEDAEKYPDYKAGAATLTGATFTNHNNAIYAYGALNTNDCVFYKNEGTMAGAAIFAQDSSVYTDNGSSFVENSTTDIQAGALSLYGDTVLTNTKFYRNTAPEGRGGAILASGSSHTLLVTGAYFEGNTAKTNGGAVVLSALKLGTFDGCTFINNESGERAGALYGTSKSTMATASCLFEGNKSKTGGAISIATNVPYTDGVEGQTDKGSTFKNNVATGAAGALHLTKESSIYGARFEGNTAGTHGGAIYMSVNVNVFDSSFIGNSADGNGGAIYVSENGTLTYTSSDTLGVTNGEVEVDYAGPIFKDNVADAGGAIYLSTVLDPEENPDHVRAAATITGATFTGHGNAIYATGVLNTNNCVFYKNEGKSSGAAVSTTGGSAYTDNGSVFVENSTTAQAGAVSLYGDTVLTDSKFYRNSSTADRAGALLATGSSATLTATGCHFEGNTATSNGGAVVLTAHKLAMFDRCTFISNESGNRAGALYGTKNTTTVTISCLFEGNKGVNGGAISTATSGAYTDGVEGQTDKGSIFRNNTSTGSEGGGAIHSYGPTSLYGTEFEGNTATTNGGAIYVSESMTLNGVKFTSNTAANGGAIYTSGGGIALEDTTVTANASGIYVDKGDVVVSGTVKVSGNTAYNIYHAEGKDVVVGVLGADSVICVTVKDAEENYVDSFEIIQYPLALNQYTMIVTGNASYQWYTLKEGVWTAIEGETSAKLGSGTQGETYKCVAKLGESELESFTLVYQTQITTQSHPVCGAECDHDGAHASVTFSPIFSAGEFMSAAKQGGNYYLANDIVLDATVGVTAKVNICLNGKKLSRTGDTAFAMINVAESATLTLTDCGNEERKGYIDPTTKLWTEGEYTGEETVTVVTLKGGLITNGEGAGGVAIYSEGALNTVGVNFAGNVSEVQGSAISVSTSGSYTDNGSVFVGNTSTQQAGAVQVYGVTTLENTQFIGNYSSNRGGALLAAYGSVLATNVSFKDNVAATQGGAVVFTAIDTVLLDGCTFENNSATRAGALYGTSNSHTITTGCKFIDNSSAQGGAVSIVTAATYVDGVAGQTDKGSFFQNNTSTGDAGGGAIHSYGPASLYGTKFEGNTATTNNGGAICTSNTLTLDSCEFTSNSAVDGGAIYATGDTFTDNNSTFTSNTSTSEGGAIYVTAAASLNGTRFDGNKAGPGGAIYIRNKLTNTLIGVTLTNNKATNGSVYIGGAGVTYIEGMVATNNASTGHGGVIYATTAKTEVNINSATLSGNTYTKNAIRGFVKTGNATTHVKIYKPGIVEDGLAGDDIPNWDEMVVPYDSTTALLVTYLEEPVALPAN